MNIRGLRLWCMVAFSGVLMASCKVTQPYQIPAYQSDNLYRDVETADTTGMASLPWNEIFTDSVLQGLIREGIDRNLNLQMAYQRIIQARAYFLQSKAAFYPSLDANASISFSKLSEAQGFGIRTSASQYQLGLSAAWEVDIWGKLSSSKRAAMASLLQSEAGARAVQTSLIAEIANAYYLTLALDQQLVITELTVANWDTTVQTMRLLKEAAVVTEAAVVQSEAQRYVAEVTIPDLKQSIRETENMLSILLGRPAGRIARGSMENLEPRNLLETGVPARLLANRPDVQQAELNLRYYFEMTNVARTYFYPALTISGSAGLSALRFEELFNPVSIAANIGAGLLQPVFNKRMNKTRLEVAKSQQQEALLNFRNTMLVAGQEVSNALYAHQAALEKMNIRANQMIALQTSVSYSQELLRNGFANYTEVITARQSLLQAQLGGVNDRLQRFRAVVNLYRALGGGWKEVK